MVDSYDEKKEAHDYKKSVEKGCTCGNNGGGDCDWCLSRDNLFDIEIRLEKFWQGLHTHESDREKFNNLRKDLLWLVSEVQFQRGLVAGYEDDKTTLVD